MRSLPTGSPAELFPRADDVSGIRQQTRFLRVETGDLLTRAAHVIHEPLERGPGCIRVVDRVAHGAPFRRTRASARRIEQKTWARSRSTSRVEHRYGLCNPQPKNSSHATTRRDAASVVELYVVPEFRGDGTGGAIVDRLVTECAAAGVSAIEVNVDEGDVDALRFYDRHGFELLQPTTGERAFYLSMELDA